ncbi:DUF58 domain-containing protein [Thiomicrorhabdus heinhorstiae]|uniref:DUF58 domain-containing protein n=1 Tax=Thiomicrorhabdus heinhorstiae TaxID=2748010 RepID=A0ABS0BX78_9GAMM|nr:DUF58 domain-containing protein [Thiomicrorhabdus heinhorstiae]MBF6057698.1 DUF58 domain-containing protein [Thiomicrorhabdus heinhorstiae]
MLSNFVSGWQAVRQRFRAVAKRADAMPLLSDEEIAVLAESLESWRSKGAWKERLSQAMRQGRQSSRFRGSGMEYEESRPYLPGDELRHINWRLMARTGEAFSKRFEETRQSQWWILLDCRESMRFGTRKRLKATQAARLSGALAWMAQSEGLRLNLLRLDEELSSLPTLFGRDLFSQTMKFSSQACPPKEGANWPGLEAALNHLLPQFRGGDRLWILSDFYDLSDHSLQLIYALSECLNLHAIWLRDPVENALPDISGMSLHSAGSKALHIQNRQQLEAYQAWAQAYFSAGECRLRQAGVEMSFIESTDEVEDFMSRLLHQLEL